MKYIIRVLVPGTKNLDYQADRLPAYTAEFTEAEKNDVLSQLDTLAPQVLQVRDLWNVNRPGNESTLKSVRSMIARMQLLILLALCPTHP